MNLLSKTAPLEESIQKMRAVLIDVGCEVVFQEQLHPLTHCYSVNLSSTEAPRHIYANGKGMEVDASVASALGEYIERLQTNNFFIDFYLPNRTQYPDEVAYEFWEDYIDEAFLELYDPNGELSGEDLVDFNSDYTDKILCLPFIKNSTQEKVYIPQNILSNLYVSNGLATGNSPKEAQVQAFSEIYERYAKLDIIKNGYALPSFPDELIQSFEKLQSDVQALRDLGYIVEVLDASMGGKFPVTAISLINPKNSSLFVSFGAHPILQVSLERTMTELMQGRTLDNLDSFETPTFDMSRVESSFNLESHFVDSNGKLGFGFLSSKKSFEYATWRYKGEGCEDEYNFLLSILEDMDKELYIREYDYLGFYSCQMVIPGVSEVYPMEDLIYNNKNSGKLIRHMVLDMNVNDAEDILDAVESLDDSLHVDKYIGVIFENSFTMAELKAQMHLTLGNTQEALEILEYSENKIGQILVELITMENEGHNYEDYEEALENVFGKDNLKKALLVREGKELFIDTTLHDEYKKMLKLYDKLEIKKQNITL
ncbi:MAG: YcaO-like family protein [Thiovulaceae bacterium]|nr:YcaO-like family protein [Sulfurimonadaceae bacterium]